MTVQYTVPLCKYSQGIGKLILGRTDVYIDIDNNVSKYLNSDKYKKSKIIGTIYNIGLMEKTTGHTWLHKKHYYLSSELSSHFRDMKKEGLFEVYLNEVGLTSNDIKW